MKYYIKVTCAFKWARKLPRKTETYASAKCVPCNTRKCTHNGFVSDLLKCRFYATGPRAVNRINTVISFPIVHKYQLEITCRLSEIQLALLKSKCWQARQDVRLYSLHNKRLEVVGARKNGRPRRRHARSLWCAFHRQCKPPSSFSF